MRAPDLLPPFDLVQNTLSILSLIYTTRKRAIGLGQRYQLLLQPVQLVPLALDQPSGGQFAPGGGSNRFQCVSIGTGLNHHPVPNEGGAIGTGWCLDPVLLDKI